MYPPFVFEGFFGGEVGLFLSGPVILFSAFLPVLPQGEMVDVWKEGEEEEEQ